MAGETCSLHGRAAGRKAASTGTRWPPVVGGLGSAAGQCATFEGSLWEKGSGSSRPVTGKLAAGRVASCGDFLRED